MREIRHVRISDHLLISGSIGILHQPIPGCSRTLWFGCGNVVAQCWGRTLWTTLGSDIVTTLTKTDRITLLQRCDNHMRLL